MKNKYVAFFFYLPSHISALVLVYNASTFPTFVFWETASSLVCVRIRPQVPPGVSVNVPHFSAPPEELVSRVGDGMPIPTATSSAASSHTARRRRSPPKESSKSCCSLALVISQLCHHGTSFPFPLNVCLHVIFVHHTNALSGAGGAGL